MSTLAHALVSWDDFVRLPEAPGPAERYELHDGEVVVVPPPRPLHLKIQTRTERLLQAIAADRGIVRIEFPYRPLPNLQYWIADVVYIPQAEWDAMPLDSYPVYAPPLIVEVLSPSNIPAKVNRQRIVALSGGTQEFWVVDPSNRTVQITNLTGTEKFAAGSSLPVRILGAATIPVEAVFEI